MDVFGSYPMLRGLVGLPTQYGESREDWNALFVAEPDGMLRIFADIIKSEYAAKGRVGQRPMPREEQVNVNQFLSGDFTDRSMPEVLPRMIKTSRREFAARVGMSWTQFRRVMSGEVVPDPSQIRRMAKELNCSPLYFIEYRKMMMVAAMVNLFESKPDLMNSLVSRYVRAKAGVEVPETTRQGLR